MVGTSRNSHPKGLAKYKGSTVVTLIFDGDNKQRVLGNKPVQKIVWLLTIWMKTSLVCERFYWNLGLTVIQKTLNTQVSISAKQSTSIWWIYFLWISCNVGENFILLLFCMNTFHNGAYHTVFITVYNSIHINVDMG